MNPVEEPSRGLRGLDVLVTGAGGFIGSALLPALCREGARVRALVAAPGQPARNVPDGVVTLRAEIDDAAAIACAVRDCDVVVHLAGPSSVAASFESPAAYARAHTVGTATVVDACRRASVRGLVHVSSAEVYGQPLGNPVREDHPLRARSPYGAAKIGAEGVVSSMSGSFRGGVVVLRPFSVYGPGSDSRSVLGTILEQALSAREIVLGDLRPVRDYCFVADVADAIVRAARVVAREPSGEHTPSLRIYNVGSGSGTTVGDLARAALTAAGRSDLPVRDDPARRRPSGNDIFCLLADPALAARDLGWRAHTPLVAGLRATLDLDRWPEWNR